MGVGLLAADQHIVDVAGLRVKMLGHAAAGLLLQRQRLGHKAEGPKNGQQQQHAQRDKKPYSLVSCLVGFVHV